MAGRNGSEMAGRNGSEMAGQASGASAGIGWFDDDASPGWDAQSREDRVQIDAKTDYAWKAMRWPEVRRHAAPGAEGPDPPSAVADDATPDRFADLVELQLQEDDAARDAHLREEDAVWGAQTREDRAGYDTKTRGLGHFGDPGSSDPPSAFDRWCDHAVRHKKARDPATPPAGAPSSASA